MIAKFTQSHLEQWWPSLEKMAQQFHAEVSGQQGAFAVNNFKDYIRRMMDNGALHCFALWLDGVPCEVIGMLRYDDPFLGKPCATLLFWWLNGRHNSSGKLYLEAEAWAEEAGCAKINVASPVVDKYVKAHQFYKMMGFEVAEVAYSKTL